MNLTKCFCNYNTYARIRHIFGDMIFSIIAINKRTLGIMAFVITPLYMTFSMMTFGIMTLGI
jgi:hypothetical protein